MDKNRVYTSDSNEKILSIIQNERYAYHRYKEILKHSKISQQSKGSGHIIKLT